MNTFGQGNNNSTSTTSELTDNSINPGVGSLSKKEDGSNTAFPHIGGDNGDNKDLNSFAQALNRTQENPSNRTQKDRLEWQKNAIQKRKERFNLRNIQENLSAREQADQVEVAQKLNGIRNQVKMEADQKGNREASTALTPEIVNPKSGSYHKNWLIWMQLSIRDTAKSDSWLETFKAKGKRYRGLDYKKRAGSDIGKSTRLENNSGANTGG